MEQVEIKVYEIVVYNKELGIIVYKPYAVKNFDLKEFLSHQPACVCIAFNGMKTEKVPAWTVPKDVDFIE